MSISKIIWNIWVGRRLNQQVYIVFKWQVGEGLLDYVYTHCSSNVCFSGKSDKKSFHRKLISLLKKLDYSNILQKISVTEQLNYPKGNWWKAKFIALGFSCELPGFLNYTSWTYNIKKILENIWNKHKNIEILPRRKLRSSSAGGFSHFWVK